LNPNVGACWEANFSGTVRSPRSLSSCNLSAEMQSPHSACYCDSLPQVKTCLFALPFALTDSRLLVADR